MASDDEILIVKELGEILQVHPSTIYKLTRQGKIPAFRVGNDWRFRKDVIERWIGEEAIALEAE